MQVPEQVRAAVAGVLGHQMAAGVEQPASLDRKQRGAIDRQLGAVLFGVSQGFEGDMAAGAAGVGAAGEATQGGAGHTHAITGGLVGVANLADDLWRGGRVVLGPVNHADDDQDLPVRLVLTKVFSQRQDEAKMVFGSEEPEAGGAWNRRINSCSDRVFTVVVGA